MPNFPTSFPRCFIYCANVEASGTPPRRQGARTEGHGPSMETYGRAVARMDCHVGLGKVWNWQLELLLFIGTMKGNSVGRKGKAVLGNSTIEEWISELKQKLNVEVSECFFSN